MATKTGGAKKKDEATEIIIREVQTSRIDVCVLGTRPLILNRMSEKAWRELLLPAPKKNRADKASTLKHEPLEEYRASVYQSKNKKDDTALMLPVQCFKNAGLTAALDMPGSSKTQMGRLIWLTETWVPIYGVPQISMMIVRLKDINRTPDVRTRAIIPYWAAKFSVEFVTPILNAQSVYNVLMAGGLIAGVGDFRQEKGKGNFGQFALVQPNDERFLRVVANGKRDAQLAALKNPGPYDEETADLLTWFYDEIKRRGTSSAQTRARGDDAATPTPRKTSTRRRSGNGEARP